MKEWIKEGLTWGMTMFLIIVVVVPWFEGEEITLKRVLVGVLIWGVGGLFYGFLMSKVKADS